MRQVFVFLKPKPANKKTPDLDRSPRAAARYGHRSRTARRTNSGTP